MAASRSTLITTAMFAERWILSVIFFYLAWTEFVKADAIHAGLVPHETSSVFVDVAHHYILFVLAALTGVFLLVARRASVAPERLRFVLVPLATTFFTLLYYTVPHFTPAMRASLAPPQWRSVLTTAGLACVIIGPFISLWAITHLGRSFGVFVAVRTVVLTGPYRWVRHPMYLGWIVVCLGVALANFSIAYFLLTSGHVALLVYRARLEEKNLIECDAAYREHAQTSGFIFPRFGQRSNRADRRQL
jgi:protein-S-isoprenylcysteine O-methyltransferase Ste14